MAKGKHSLARSRFPFFLRILLIIMICMATLFIMVIIKKDGHFFSAKTNKNQKTESGSQEKMLSEHNTRTKIILSEEDTEEKVQKEKETKKKEEKKKEVTSIETDRKVLMMQEGDTYKVNVEIQPSTASNIYNWSSNHAEIASVDSLGNITAISDGNAVITCSFGEISCPVYVNVVSQTPDGEVGHLSLYQEDGRLIHYNLYHQSSHEYGNYSSYMAWHGCATCSTTTVLGAYSKQYQDIHVVDMINTVEKNVTGSQNWTREHVTKDMNKQMPISLSGISSIFTYGGIRNEYIRSFQQAEAKKDILSHLTTGNPVLFEVRKKSNITGKKDSPWTGSVHTMVFLGVYTNGKVLVCDSVNHSWYSGGQRAKIANIEDLMEYMYSCTDFNKHPYYKSVSSDGGYIKIYDH